MKRLIYLFTIFLILSPVFGELVHINIGSLNFLLSDLFIVLLFVSWMFYKIINKEGIVLGRVSKMIIVFIFALVFSYVINLFRFDINEMKGAFSYLLRFIMYLFIPIISFDLLSYDKKNYFKKLLVYTILTSAFLIAIFGFLQLKFFPSFLDLGMYLSGWDPHVGRLLSTWFDPNYVGGFLAFTSSISISLSLYFYKHEKKKFYLLSVFSFILLLALYLTYSRSSYLAMILSLSVLALFRSRKLLLISIISIVIAFSFSSRVQERTLSAVDSAKSLFALDSQVALDPTAELRVWSWKFAKEIIYDHPIIGVSYNRYAYEINNRGHGLLSDHSSSGSDSSLLTIWACSGIIGLLSYLSIAFVAFLASFRRILSKDDLSSYLDLGILSAFIGMMIHSVFVNSLLYSLMMVYLMFGLSLLDEK